VVEHEQQHLPNVNGDDDDDGNIIDKDEEAPEYR